jgi:transcriptional regulator NrdR family protein
MVMESLKELDPVAYVRYASIHRRFYCLEDYQKILDTLG